MEPVKEGKVEQLAVVEADVEGKCQNSREEGALILNYGLSKDACFTPSLDDYDDDDDSVRLQNPDNRERIKDFSAIHPSADENKMSMQP